MKKIIFVSRLDRDCSLGALLLCSLAPRLAARYEDLKIIIIGGGTEYQRIFTKASYINMKTKRALITVTGKMSNPSSQFQKGALFVGVSRAALEAMAFGLPVILLGNEGYLGLLEEAKLDYAKKTNFTCRGATQPNSSESFKNILYNEICRFFSLSEKDKAHLALLSQQIVEKNYTARKMAENTMRYYVKTLERYYSTSNPDFKRGTSSQNARARQNKIAICGYYGHKNLGDDTILSVIRKIIQKNSKEKLQIHVINDKNPFKIVLALIHAKLFIFGGGSLLQNSTSNASLLYYLTLIRIARLFCKRTVMLANGFGPIEDGVLTQNLLIKKTRNALKTFDYISVRDSDSQATLSSLLPDKSIHLIPDPAVICAKRIGDKLIKPKDYIYFLYIPCLNELKKSEIKVKSILAALSELEYRYNIPPAIAVLNSKEDKEIALQIKKALKGVRLFFPTSPKELCNILAKSKFVISQRYHGAIFACACASPLLTISNDPKMQGLCKDFHLFPAQNTTIFNTPLSIPKQLSLCMEHCNKNASATRKSIESCARQSEEMIKKILKNC